MASVRAVAPVPCTGVRHYIREGYRVKLVDCDLARIFDTVEHDVLAGRVGKKVRDKRVLKLIGTYLRAVVIGDRLHETPQGCTSKTVPLPLLSNILLDELDKELEGRGHQRYMPMTSSFW